MRRYFFRFSTTFFGLLIAIATMNLIVDPYVVYRIGPSTWNSHKRQAEHWISRGETAARNGFDVLIAGDSRALNGLSPDHPALTSYGSVYNISVAGASLFETQKLLEVALDSPHPPRLILWSVPAAPGLSPTQIGDDFEWSQASASHATVEKHVHYLWSLAAANDSLHAVGCVANGHDYGIRQGFQAKPRYAASRAQFMACIPKLLKPLTTAEIDERVQGARATVGAVAERCRAMGTELVIVFPAVHSSFLRGIVDDGGWQVFQGQKAVAVDIANGVNRSGGMMQVWDFTSFSGLNDEPIMTSPGDRMRWYLDASHFSQELGDRALNRIFGREDSDDLAIEFGRRLTPENVAAHLAWQATAAGINLRGEDRVADSHAGRDASSQH